jgi:hypothetical protein
MIFTNSKGYEYHIRLVGQEGDDLLTLDNIRIDHTDGPDMTLEEYFAFAGAEAERPYFEFMELEILDSLQEGNGLEITKDDLNSLPKEFVNIRIYRADRDRLATHMRYGETMADAIHALMGQTDKASDDPCPEEWKKEEHDPRNDSR